MKNGSKPKYSYIFILTFVLLWLGSIVFFPTRTKKATLTQPECDAIYTFTKWQIHINIGINKKARMVITQYVIEWFAVMNCIILLLQMPILQLR